jgi:GT2 family glycosyltransferase
MPWVAAHPDATGMTATATALATGTVCTAVVVHYREAGPTLACLASLRAQQPPVEVVLVDNASPDGSGDELERALVGMAGVTLLRSPWNGGFGAGCNLGMAFALRSWPEAEHLLLLNPDAELTSGALAELLATAERHPDAAIVGCRIDGPDGRPWFRNGHVPRWTLSGFHVEAPAADEHPSEFVSGACMLLRADLLHAGLRFEESFFLYCEDADLCCEVRQRGWQVWVTQRALAHHAGGGSQPGENVLGELTAERLFWLTRAKVMFARRRLSCLQRLCFGVVAAIGKPLAGVLKFRSLRFLPAYYRGLWSGLRAPLRRFGLRGRLVRPAG